MADTKLLKIRMVTNNISQKQLAQMLAITESSLCHKINNKKAFKSNEIKQISEILQMSDTDIRKYFLN